MSTPWSYEGLIVNVDIVIIIITVVIIISFMVIIFVIIQVLKKMEMVDKDQVNEENETTLNVTDEDGLGQ